MIHFRPMLRRAAATLLACYRVLTKCPVLRERDSRRVAPGPGQGPEAAAILVLRCRRGETPFASSAAILFSPEFTLHLSGGTPLTGAYLADHFRGLEVLLFRPGPVLSTGALR
ncbi:hypothetical protein NDU88_007258 [Pleurodeles waltl]|uniref:AraC family transcriptional regulator n=1 Tax=Pleurodeles waltl TaxID=8319 RepID=A0AAV7LUC4_PLEWA|nr:hypothetical protein NDU88_007258 [Pleurodeles waltl]